MPSPSIQAPTIASAHLAWVPKVRSRRSELFVDPRWYEVLNVTYGLTIDVHTHGTSILPISEIDDPRGRRFKSLPFCDFVDAPMNAADWPALIDPILDEGSSVTVETLADHPAVNDPRFESVNDGVHHIIEVGESLEAMAPSFGTLTRRQIRRAERSEIRYDVSTSVADLRAFHDMHVDVRRNRHGLLAQPFTMFEAIAGCFGSDFALVVGRRSGEIVGGCLLIRTDNAWHYKFSASAASARADGVSHGAVAAALQHCIDTNVPLFDFGRSDLAHAGLVDFKRRFAPNEIPLVCHTAGSAPANAFSRDLHHLTQLFTSPGVPQAITAEAGATLYRYFA